jgi:hypothetical protein
MAFPAVGTVSGANQSTATTQHSITLPGSISAGDLLLVVFAGRWRSTDSAYVASGTAWRTLGVSPYGGAIQLGIAAFAKIADGSDALTIGTTSAVLSCHRCYRITGHGSTVTISSVATGASGNINPPTVTQTGSAQDTLFIAAGAIRSGTVPSAAPAGYANLYTQTVTNLSIGVAEITANATSEDPGTFTNTSVEWCSYTFAVASTNISTNAHNSQIVAEALSTTSPNAHVSQIVAEALSTTSPNAHLSQIVVEVLSTDDNITAGGSKANLFILF